MPALEPIRKGATFTRRYTFETSPGVPRNLSGLTITFVIHDTLLAPHTYTTSSGVTVTAASGIVDIALTPTQTNQLEENNGALSYVKFVLGSGAIEDKAQEIERIVPAGAVD